MAARFPFLCTCGNVVPAGERCACQIARARARKARHDARRPNARARGYNRRWEAARRDYLDAFPFCRRCGNPATIVDHITPHRGDDRLFWDRSNWQPLCAPCHNRHKQREEHQQ
ncbi:HNH endonuclease signature motif containing protein [Pararhizobium mangrovi]|uniref:Putative HNH nuclease YajD n=1 Tax=Pararhizobium mangrovi TaxID=2590452 RepID=A0A506TYI9_9HYPH|nr:HNH endonuclease signature motif containing protein [Pararhizobium mangrovi]TPW26386.1 HNH endonuclease [Pararhizobium mangrovi]